MKKIVRLLISIIILVSLLVASVGLTSIAVKNISISTSSIRIQIGKTFKLDVTFTPENATNKRVLFSSANKKIATVDKNGNIKGITPGKTVITVSSVSNKKAVEKCSVTITEKKKLVEMTLAGTRAIGVAAASWMQKKMEEEFNLKIKLERLPSGNDTKTRLGVLIASGNIPDVMYGVDWRALQEQGVLGEVSPEMYKKYAPRIYTALIKMADISGYNVFNVWSINGKFYGYPSTTAWGYKPAYSRSWRVDLLNKAGIKEVPDSIEKAEQAFSEIKKINPAIYGISGAGRSNYPQLFTDIYGAYAYAPDMMVKEGSKIISSFMKPEMKDALTTLARWYRLGYLDPEYLTDDTQTYNRKWTNGALLSYIWASGEQKGSPDEINAQAVNPEAKMELGPNLIGPKGRSGMYAWLPFNGMIVFSKSFAADENKMGRFLEIADNANYDSDTYLWMTCGEKGKHFVFDANGKTQWKEPYTMPAEREVQGIGGAGYFYWFFSYSGYHLELMKKYGLTDSWIKYDRKFKANPQNKVYIPVTNAVPIPQKMITENKIDLEIMWKDYFDSIIMGKKKIDEYDEFLKKWLDGGGQKRIDYLNENALKILN